MTDLIHQIVDIVKNIAHIFDSSILVPLTLLFKSLGALFVKVLELVVMIVKWIFTKV